MTVPLWLGILAPLAVIVAAVIGGFFGLKNNNRNARETQTATLLHGQQDIIEALQGNTTSYQDILEKWAASVKKEAETAATLKSMDAELKALKAEFKQLQDSFTALSAQYSGANERASRVPQLEQEIADLKVLLIRESEKVAVKDAIIAQKDGHIAHKDDLISHKDDLLDLANIEAKAALSGQNYVEGALSGVTGALRDAERFLAENDCQAP